MRWTRLLAVMVAACLAAATRATAEDPAAAAPAGTDAGASSPWTFEAMPYAWIPGNFGTITVQGRTASVDVSVKDALDLATSGNAFTAGGYFGLAYDRYQLFVDAFGGYAEAGVTETVPTQLCDIRVSARQKLKFDFVDVGLGYRLGRWSLPHRRRPLTLDVYVGTRYAHLDSRLNASAGVAGAVQRSASSFENFDWADPMLGVRWELPILDPLSLEFRGDIGGFDASSRLVWGLVAGVRYWLPWTPWSVHPWLSAGYRVIAIDRGSGPDGVDMQFRGPLGGMGIRF